MSNYISTILILILIVIVAYIYNMLVRKRNKVKENYATMDSYLKKRWDLVPNLVEVVKGYSAFEQSTLEKITALRNTDYQKMEMNQKLNVDDNISKVVSKIIAVSENYPDLKANEQYLNLSKELSKVEEEIVNSRKNYNESVKNYNDKIQVVPNNLVAIMFGFDEEAMFEARSEEKKNVKVDL